MRTIAVFARWPRPGHAKTRLIPVLTAALTHQLQLAMLGDALDAMLGASAERRTLWWAGAPADRAAVTLPDTIEVFDQTTGDLGDRLEHAFARLHRAPDQRVVLIGSDCPWLDSATIDQGFAALERNDVVMSPAEDGGFQLIGLGSSAARRLSELFRGIAWSTERTLEDTLARMAATGLSVELVKEAADVDTATDVIAFLRRAMRDPAGARQTRAALAAMGLLPAPGGETALNDGT